MRRVALALLVLAAACGGNDDDPAPAASASTSTSASSVASTTTTVDDDDVYADPASWLCRPDSDDPCDGDLDATIVQADGTTTLEPFVPATDALIDCFYVYPTVSNDPDAQSDMVPNAEEMSVVRNQAARLGSVCDVYAPMYRQATLTELQRTLGGASGFFAAVGLAYPDVLAAWRHYLAEDNDGRGVVVIGHSQGAGHLAQLLREEIDPNEDQRSLLVSGILLGNSAYASDYPNLHACAAADDTGCIASYSSFRSTAPPPANSFFARARGGEEAICTNPAAMSAASATCTRTSQAPGWAST